MKITFLRAERVFLVLYVVSVMCSIAGMETFSTLLALMGLVALIARKKLELPAVSFSTNADWALLGFWAWVGICLFIIPEVNPAHRLDVFGSLRWILLFYFVRFALIRNFDFFKRCTPYFLGLVLAISIYGVIQFQTGIDFVHSSSFGYGEGFWRTRGLFGSVMSFSYVFGMIYFFVVARTMMAERVFSRKNGILLATTFFLTWALLGTYTRGLWIAMVVGVTLITFFKKRKQTLWTIGTVALIGVVTFAASDNVRTRFDSFLDFSAKNESNYYRVQLWRANFELFLERPVMGAGFRQNATHVQRIFDKLNIDSDFVSHAHNNLLSVLGGTGLVGFILYLAFNLIFLLTAYRLFRRSSQEDTFAKAIGLGALGALVSFHIGGLTESNFYDGETTHALLLTCAILYATSYVREQKLKTNV